MKHAATGIRTLAPILVAAGIAGCGGSGDPAPAPAPVGDDAVACLNTDLWNQSSSLELSRRTTFKDDSRVNTSSATVTTTLNVTFGGVSTTEYTTVVNLDPVTTTSVRNESLAGSTILRYGIQTRTEHSDGTILGETNGEFRPALQDLRFTLATGESVSSTSDQFVDDGTGSLVDSGAVTFTYTYIGREAISVESRSFNTCHFQIETSDAGETTTEFEWLEVGSGVLIRSEDDVSFTELLSGTINGALI